MTDIGGNAKSDSALGSLDNKFAICRPDCTSSTRHGAISGTAIVSHHDDQMMPQCVPFKSTLDHVGLVRGAPYPSGVNRGSSIRRCSRVAGVRRIVAYCHCHLLISHLLQPQSAQILLHRKIRSFKEREECEDGGITCII